MPSEILGVFCLSFMSIDSTPPSCSHSKSSLPLDFLDQAGQRAVSKISRGGKKTKTNPHKGEIEDWTLMIYTVCMANECFLGILNLIHFILKCTLEAWWLHRQKTASCRWARGFQVYFWMDDKGHFFCRTSKKGSFSDLNSLQTQLQHAHILQQNCYSKTTHFSIQLHIQSQSLRKSALITLNNGIIYTQLLPSHFQRRKRAAPSMLHGNSRHDFCLAGKENPIQLKL